MAGGLLTGPLCWVWWLLLASLPLWLVCVLAVSLPGRFADWSEPGGDVDFIQGDEDTGLVGRQGRRDLQM